jgi:phage shock protein C
MTTRLMRSREKMLAGVCAGVGAYFGIDAAIVRIVFVFAVLSGLSPLIYLILWVIMPEAPAVEPQPRYDPYTGQPLQ